ncbi:MAG: MTH1187 family thiamine-binding protein [Pseudonocardiales bacterium]
MLVAFTVTPLGESDSVSEPVAEAVRVVRESGLPNETTAMFTLIEGDWDEVMDVVKRAVEAVIARTSRVTLSLNADVRPGYTGQLRTKVARVEEHLAAPGDSQLSA